MGNKTNKGKKESHGMPEDLKNKALELFNKIDTDRSGAIDREETLKFWGKNFAKVNTQELFQSVDKDNSGTIEQPEWLEFWHNVYLSGQSKDDIIAEVIFLKQIDIILEGGSWVKYGEVEDLNTHKSSIKKGKK